VSPPVADHLARPATLDRVYLVSEAVGLPEARASRLRDLAARTPTRGQWQRFLAAALLVLGAGLVLSGIVSFFAFNWAALGKFTKMALIAASVAACAIGALPRPDTLVARVLLFAASVLVGALLAVFGQTYQTGADPWGLFAVWALLILPWTVAACFTPLWLLWIALIDVAFGLYVAQVLASPGWDVTLLLGLVGMHVVAVMAWEFQHMASRSWLADTWAPRVLVVATLAPLLAPSLAVVVNPGWTNRLGPVAFGVLAFLVVLVGLFYSLVRRDTFMLTVAAGSVMAIFTAGVARLLTVTLGLGVLGMMVTTAIIVLEATLVVSWLRQQARDEAA
jgi:uncharacterized membrane protein